MAIHGKGGNVSADGGSTYLNELDNWSVNENGDAEESTDFQSDGEREYVAGLTDWDGSFSGRWEAAQANSVEVGTTIDVQLEIDGSNHYAGQAIVTGRSVDTTVDGLVEASYDIQGTGSLTLTTA